MVPRRMAMVFLAWLFCEKKTLGPFILCKNEQTDALTTSLQQLPQLSIHLNHNLRL